jgi:hypothetical protein
MKGQEGMEVRSSLDFGTSLRLAVIFTLLPPYPSAAHGTHCLTEHTNPRATINTVTENLSLPRIRRDCSNRPPRIPVTILIYPDAYTVDPWLTNLIRSRGLVVTQVGRKSRLFYPQEIMEIPIMRSEPPRAPLIYPFHKKKGCIMCVIYQKHQ